MRIQVQLLGHFTVKVDATELPADAWRRERGSLLVKLLAVSPGHRVHREQVMDRFWPDLEPEAAGANLRKALHFARRAVGEHGLLSQSGDVLLLAPNDELVIDAEDFETAASVALRTKSHDDCVHAADLYGGELLPDDLYVEWLEEPRKRLHERYARVLRAGKLWERLVALEPNDEEAQCALMQAALESGNRGEVIRLFARLRERLRLDLGVGPKAATVALYERALEMPSAEPSNASERVRAALAWGLVHLQSGDYAKAERIARETRDLSVGADLGREVGECSALLGLAAHMQGRISELLLAEFSEWIRRASKATPVFEGHLCLTQFSLCGAGGHQQIGVAAREMLSAADAADSDAGRALALLSLGEVALFSGNLDEAEPLLVNSERLHAATNAFAGRAMALQRLAELALARGDEKHAAELLALALDAAESTWLKPHLSIRLRGLAVQLASTPEQACELVAEGDRSLADGSSCQPCSMGFRVASAIALAEAGELDRVGKRLDEAERISGMWGGGPWQAALWEARGVQRRASGNEERALAAFGEAAASFADLGRKLDEARCRARVRAGSGE